MTDEELAMEITNDLDTMVYDCEGGCVNIYDNIERAVLIGIKAGKPKWHDLRKNPDDLPPRIKRFSETVINQIGTPCRYNFEKSCWQNWSYIDIETPIAWCELPKFEEKRK